MKSALLYFVYLFTLMSSSWSQETKLMPLVLQAERDVVDLTAPGALHGSKSFVELRDNPDRYVDEALTLLADEETSLQQKMIVAYGMQKLGKASYAAFLAGVVQRFEKGECPDRIMELLIFPGFEWGVTVIENYKDPSIVQTLHVVKDSTRASARFKAMIDGVLSGKTWAKAKRFLADQKKS